MTIAEAIQLNHRLTSIMSGPKWQEFHQATTAAKVLLQAQVIDRRSAVDIFKQAAAEFRSFLLGTDFPFKPEFIDEMIQQWAQDHGLADEVVEG